MTRGDAASDIIEAFNAMENSKFDNAYASSTASGLPAKKKKSVP
jgi:hypothetical protein